MKRKKPEFVFLRVTTSQLYVFEERSVNGWSTEKVIEEWFHQYPIDASHASRDGSKVGNSTLVLAVEALEDDTEYTQKLQEQAICVNKRCKETIEAREQEYKSFLAQLKELK